ncbi:hypothetical protein [Mammaliicoccus sciuri]|uniref:hypothetical protein n=1 Tax=Mammaliicoccus sciuri TaxID=1296 RepID=UPI000D1F60F4|nr:hypothetical protein [Mammaliicoccus sciuri]PTJ54237.1 hypothetical protein BU012_01170 [Mammaliicoccus sciuri]
MWQITKITMEIDRNRKSDGTYGVYYKVVIARLTKPFKTRVKRVSEEVFTEREFYIGRILDL